MKILMVLAHADDEIIFGYPYFQRSDLKITLLLCSTDHENPSFKDRISVIRCICSERNADLHMIESRSNFYSLNSLNGSLRNFYTRVISELEKLQNGVDAIFTHNPHGEYGHPDHKILFDIVSTYATKPVIYTDIHVDAFWPLLPRNPLYYTKQIGKSTLDLPMYERIRSLYRQAGVWTWKDETTPQCGLFMLPRIPGEQDRYSKT